MTLQILDQANSYILKGDFSLAESCYKRAVSEGNIPLDIVNLRYMTKDYIVYPLEYEHSTEYFSMIERLKAIADRDPSYSEEYVHALTSLIDIKKLFLRSLSLFYYTDIEICQSGSFIVDEIMNIYKYLSQNIDNITNNDKYGFDKYLPNANIKKLNCDLKKIEVYCLNLLISYTAEQHSVYSGKKYSALSIDYGSFISTDIVSRDTYTNWANLKARLSILGCEAYYNDYYREFEIKQAKIAGFNSAEELKSEITALLKHKAKHTKDEKNFICYSKHFEKKNSSSESFLTTMAKINPLLKIYLKIPFIDKKRSCSFEPNNVFHRKMWLGVCDMISSGQGWSIDTVRWGMIGLSGMFIGVFIYFGLALAIKLGLYWGVNVEKY